MAAPEFSSPDVDGWPNVAAPPRRQLFTGAQPTEVRSPPTTFPALPGRALPRPAATPQPMFAAMHPPGVDNANNTTADIHNSVWDAVETSSSRFLEQWGGSQHITSLTSLALITTTLVTTTAFAPRYSQWNKSFSNSVPGFAETMKDKYPVIHASLVAVPSLVGTAARTAFLDAFESLRATFGGVDGAKELFLVALAVWCLLSAKSSKQSYLNFILQLYLWLPDSDPSSADPDVASLRAAVSNPDAWATLTAASTAMMAFDVYTSPGIRRLDPAMNSSSAASALRCVTSWNGLLAILVDAITFSTDAKEVEFLRESLKPGTHNHDQGPTEPIVEYLARIEMGFLLTCNRLRALNKSRLVPHQDMALVDIAMSGCKPSTLEHFRRIWTDNGLSDDDMTWASVKQFLMKAGVKDSTVLQRAPPRQQPDKPKPKIKNKEKEADLDQVNTAAPLLPLPPSVLAMSPADRLAQAYAEGSCTNCLGDHHARNCDKVRCDGKDWHPGHTPGGGSKLRPQVSTPGVGAAGTLVDATPAQPAPGAPSAIARTGVAPSFADTGFKPPATTSGSPPVVARPGITQSFKAMGF